MRRSQNLYVLSLCAVLALVTLGAVFMKYSEPLTDGDIWFHLAYGRYFIENHTLVPDHSIFSWTPGSSPWIYCSWIPQIVFYLLFSAGGLPALFVLRYLLILVFLLLVFSSFPNLRDRLAYLPAVLLVCLLGLLMAQAGPRLKADIFSFLFMALLVWSWFTFKAGSGRNLKLLYSFPLLFFLWVNSHAGFVFGLVFLAVAFLGEVVNNLAGSFERLTPECLGHVMVSGALSGLATVMTPYGWAYPKMLLDQQFSKSAEFYESIRYIMEFQSTFHPAASGLHYVDYLAVSSAILLILVAWQKNKKGSIDWSVVLVNAFFIALYAKYLRFTLYWGIIFTFSSLHLLKTLSPSPLAFPSKLPVKQAALAVVTGLILFLSLRTGFETFNSPNMYAVPVKEAEFIKARFPSQRIGNDYANGTYLLWALWPGNRILIDARGGPYGKMVYDYYAFEGAKEEARRDQFTRRYPCDVWCVSYQTDLPDYFMRSKDWKLACYGPAACVFVSRRIRWPEGHAVSATEDNVGFLQAPGVSLLAFRAGDTGLAKKLALRRYPYRLSENLRNLSLDMKIRMGDGFFALKHYRDALDIFSSAAKDHPHSATLHYRIGNAECKLGNYTAAVESYRTSLGLDPRFARAYNNLGNAYLLMRRPGEALEQYSKALKIEPGNRDAKKNMPVALAHIRVAGIISRLEEELMARPGNPKLTKALLVAYLKIGDYESAASTLKQSLAYEPDNPDLYYNLACVYAKQDRKAEAVAWLKQSIGKGFRNWELMRKDPDLANIASAAKELAKNRK